MADHSYIGISLDDKGVNNFCTDGYPDNLDELVNTEDIITHRYSKFYQIDNLETLIPDKHNLGYLMNNRYPRLYTQIDDPRPEYKPLR